MPTDDIVFAKPKPIKTLSELHAADKASPDKNAVSYAQPSGPDDIQLGKPGGPATTAYQDEQQRKKDIANGIMNNAIASPLRGATFGLSDKAASAVKSLVQHGNMSEYQANLDRQQAQAKAYHSQDPYRAGASEILGGLTTGRGEMKLAEMATAKAAPSLYNFGARVVGPAGDVISGGGFLPAAARFAGSAANAGVLGGLDAAGRSQTGSEGNAFLNGMLPGAAFGGAMHAGVGTLGAAANAAAPLATRIGIATGAVNPNKVAQKLLMNNIAAHGDTPESVLARMRQLNNENEVHPRNVPATIGNQTVIPPAPATTQSTGTSLATINQPTPGTSLTTTGGVPALVKTLSEQGYSPEQIQSQVGSLSGGYTFSPPSKPVIVADALSDNPNAMRVMKTAMGTEGPGQTDAAALIAQRHFEAPNRLKVDAATNISPGTGSRATAEAIDSKYRDIASPLYDQVRAIGTVPDPEVNAYFNQSPTTRDMLSEFAENRARNNQPLAMILQRDANGNYTRTANGYENIPSMGDLLEIRKDLASHKASLWDKQTNSWKEGKDSKAVIGGTDLNKDQIQSHIDQLDSLIAKNSPDGTLNPDGTPGSLYTKAKQLHSEGSNIKNAMQQGSNIFSAAPEDYAYDFNRLGSEAEREGFRAGATGEMNNRIEKGGQNLIDKIKGPSNSTAMQQKFDLVGINDDANSLLSNSLNTEKVMHETNKALAPKISSTSLLPDSEGADAIPSAVAAAASGHPVGLVSNVMKYITGKEKAAIPSVAKGVSDIGLMNVDEFNKYIQQMNNQKQGLLSKVGSGLGGLAQYGVGGLPAAVGSEAGGLSVGGNPNGLLQVGPTAPEQQ